MKLIMENWRKFLAEDCWNGYERVPGSKKGAPGSCKKKTNEETRDTYGDEIVNMNKADREAGMEDFLGEDSVDKEKMKCNEPKRTPNHPKKSHIVKACEGGKEKIIRFGQQGVKTNQTAGQRKAFKSRHGKNIAKGKMSAAYWADKVKWDSKKTKDKDNNKWVKGS